LPDSLALIPIEELNKLETSEIFYKNKLMEDFLEKAKHITYDEKSQSYIETDELKVN
jgi:hypothetical protein